jgi:hypothetical protein
MTGRRYSWTLRKTEDSFEPVDDLWQITSNSGIGAARVRVVERAPLTRWIIRFHRFRFLEGFIIRTGETTLRGFLNHGVQSSAFSFDQQGQSLGGATQPAWTMTFIARETGVEVELGCRSELAASDWELEWVDAYRG